MKTILITGSCGFIGYNLINKIIQEKLPYNFVSVDQILEKYNLNNINKEHQFFMGDIADTHFINNVFEITKPNYILHLAAQSFVDAAITSAGPFIHSNVVGTQVMIDAAVKYGVEKFVYVSTDEVYGHLSSKSDTSWTEENFPRPRNPYAASKYAGELIVHAAQQTHGLNYNITRSCNNYGKSQPPRNLIPKIITCLLNDQPIPIHGNGTNIREWIYVADHCSAILKVLRYGQSNEIYNVGSGAEFSNLEIVHKIANKLKKNPNIKYITDRKGHDFRYSVNYQKLQNLGWSATSSLDQTLDNIIEWYEINQGNYQ